jgi:hypothetical protein
MGGAMVVAIAASASLLAPSAASANTPAVLEFVPAAGKFPVAFTSMSGEVVVEEQGGGGSLRCTASSVKGEIVGPRESVVEGAYTGCSVEVFGTEVECQSKGAQKGEIRIGQLTAELVYINKAEQKIGTVLNPKGGTYAAYECEGVPSEGTGSIVSATTPINQVTSTFTQTFSQSHGSQVPTEYENAKGEKLKAITEGSAEGKSVGTGTEATDTTKTAEPVEIKVEPENQEEKKQEESSSSGKKQEEEATAAAAAKKHQEEEAAKKRKEEEVAQKASRGYVALNGTALAVSRNGAVALELTCTGTGACEGKLTLTAKGRAKHGKRAKTETIATGSFSVAPGHTAIVTATLTAAGRALLKAGHGSLSASLVILKSSPPPSQMQRASVHLTQKAAKPKKKK